MKKLAILVAVLMAGAAAAADTFTLIWNPPMTYVDGAPLGSNATNLVYTIRADGVVMGTQTGITTRAVTQPTNTRVSYTVTARMPQVSTAGETVLSSESQPATHAVRITQVSAVQIDRVQVAP